jgi:hypothetical protein
MGLLDLPPEILQQTLLHLTTPSFFHAIRTCKELFRVADSSRAVLLHHLDRVPGITLGLKDSTISTHDLFLTLRRRGAAHLVGSNISADCKVIHMEVGPMDSTASWLADNTFALALRSSSTVYLYEVQGTRCKLKKETVQWPISSVGRRKLLKIVTVRTATYTLFSSSRHPVTEEASSQRYLYPNHQPIEDSLRHTRTAMDDNDSTSLDLSNTCYFVTIRKSASSEEFGFRMPAPAAWLGRALVPIDFAVYSPLVCAVLWDLPGSIKGSVFSQVINYTAEELPKKGAVKMSEYKSERLWPLFDRPNEVKVPKPIRESLKLDVPHSLQYSTPPQPQPLPGRVARALQSTGMTSLPCSIRFAQHGRRVQLFAAGRIIPFHVVRLPFTPHRRSEEEDSPPDPFLAPENIWVTSLHNTVWDLTTAFYSHHATRLTPRVGEDAEDSGEVEQVCTTSYLSLTTTKLSRDICYRKGAKRDVQVLCIVRAIKTLSSNDCTHGAHKDICAPLHYNNVKVVARLWGWQPSDSSLSGEQKLACCDTRIAIAEWDRIFIWSLDPKALIDEADDPVSGNTNDNDSDASSDVSEDLPAAGEKRKLPAWTYPKIYDSIMESWYVELMPIVLNTTTSKQGKEGTDVIRQMTWKDSNTLVVRTETVLQIWSVGPEGTSKRTHQILKTPMEQQLPTRLQVVSPRERRRRRYYDDYGPYTLRSRLPSPIRDYPFTERPEPTLGGDLNQALQNLELSITSSPALLNPESLQNQ